MSPEISQPTSSGPTIRSDIRLLGELLGKTLVDQEGSAHYDLEEQIRRLSKARRKGDESAGAELNELLHRIAEDPEAVCTILKAFTTWFYLVNVAEVRQRVRVLRDRRHAAEESGEAMDESILEAYSWW